MEQVDESTGEILPALVCPGQQTTVTRYRAGSKTGWCYRTPADKCAGCRLVAACRADKVLPGSYRQWYVSDYQMPVLMALAYAQTESFKQDMKLRSQAERVIAGRASSALRRALRPLSMMLRLELWHFLKTVWKSMHQVLES